MDERETGKDGRRGEERRPFFDSDEEEYAVVETKEKEELGERPR